LTDPARKKKYDSSLPFDDTIPKKDGFAADKFFQIFGDCFNSNARFSNIKPVPSLGDKNTPIEDVYKFYKFWDDFKTWREFSQFDEHDTE